MATDNETASLEIRPSVSQCIADTFVASIDPKTDLELKEHLFEMFKPNAQSDKACVDKLLHHTRKEGILFSDPRLNNFRERHKKLSDIMVDEKTFYALLGEDTRIFSRAVMGKMIIPDFLAFTKHIEMLVNTCRDNTNGVVASYIPELGKVEGTKWGCSICTVDGQRYAKGDASEHFTLQSVCKPLAYALALNYLGSNTVHKYVGHEPSGRSFNALELDIYAKPHNPMINPGAIVVCSILLKLIEPNMSLLEKSSFLQTFFRQLAAGEYVGYSHEVFMSERSTGFRNFALGYLLREKQCFPPDVTVEEVLNLYFQTCSIEINCQSLSVIASTLANGGVCPLTNERLLEPEVVRDVLSLMLSCGMYDYSGEFSFKIGLPAKSGVSGALMLVVPNVMGIGLWSPPLDTMGNSCRGVSFCEMLISDYSLHPYDKLGTSFTHKPNPLMGEHEMLERSTLHMHFAAARGDIHTLQRFYLSAFELSLTDYDGRTPLHIAAAEGHLECVRFLLETAGVSHNVVDRHGRTPLSEAKEMSRNDVVEYLEKFEGFSHLFKKEKVQDA